MKLIYTLLMLPLMLLGKGVDFPWTPIGMLSDFPSKPVIRDRLEFDFEVKSVPFAATSLFAGYIDSVGKVRANHGEGDDVEFEQTSTGMRNSWFRFVGSSTSQSVNLTSAGKKTRWMEFDGTARIYMSYVYLSQSNLDTVLRMVIPSWCGIEDTSGTKSMPNCTEVYFPKRTYSQAAGINQYMKSYFPNAVWHCEDGDFTPEQRAQ